MADEPESERADGPDDDEVSGGVDERRDGDDQPRGSEAGTVGGEAAGDTDAEAAADRASDDDGEGAEDVMRSTDLEFVGKSTGASIDEADFSPRDVAEGRVSYRRLVDAGVNPGVAARVAERYHEGRAGAGGDERDVAESETGDEPAAPDAADDDAADDDAAAGDEGDDEFPVAGMTGEEAAFAPTASTDAEELAVEVDDAEGSTGADEAADVEYVEDASIEPVEESERDRVGVQPERQEISDDFWDDGPESDEEMPLAEHIEEMMRRLGVVFLFGGVVTLVVLGLGQAIQGVPDAVAIIDFLWNHNIPGAPEDAGRRPRVYGPLELVLTKLKVAGLAGLLVGLPVFVYETYLFMRPGLYEHERRYYLAAVPTSLILGSIGMAFAHFVVLPYIFEYFTGYTMETGVTVAFGLAETFNLIILLMGYMAIVFQIPLFIMLAIMMGLVTRSGLEDKRLLFWGAFAGLAFLVSPDPTGMAPIIIAATMIVLFEGTLALLRWTGN